MRTNSPLKPFTHVDIWQRNVGQIFPHMPQLNGSDRKSRQKPPQFVSGGLHSGPHANPPSLGRQRSLGATHCVAQSPQCAGVSKGGVHIPPPSPPSPPSVVPPPS